MSTNQELKTNRLFIALARLAILFGLFVWLFWPEIHTMVLTMAQSGERAHALVILPMIMLLGYHRRKTFAAESFEGSAWGAILLIGSLVLYAASTWPFNYGYVRSLAMVPVLAGLLLVACGWGVLKISFPMLLFAITAIPIGSHIYARLIIRPETYTITATAAALGMLPGIDTVTRGIDIFFKSDSACGAVALGESYRGAKLLLAFTSVGLFVTFSRIRSIRRLILVTAAAIPIILLCNFFWLFCWGVLAIYAVANPANAWPRNISTVLSLILAYALFALVGSVNLNLFANADKQNCYREVARG